MSDTEFSKFIRGVGEYTPERKREIMNDVLDKANESQKKIAVSDLTELSDVNCRLCANFIPHNYGVCASVGKCVAGNRFNPMSEVRLYNA